MFKFITVNVKCENVIFTIFSSFYTSPDYDILACDILVLPVDIDMFGKLPSKLVDRYRCYRGTFLKTLVYA
jgi:hypothetical protein